MRFDGSCSGKKWRYTSCRLRGESPGFRLKGDYHDVYHVNAYDNARKDVSISPQKYWGLDMAGDTVPGNSNSNFFITVLWRPVCGAIHPVALRHFAPYGGF
ncbi:MAG: hypothetical protein Ct9H300mP21_06070 [Pseudomonadota bacterium]|nr:MAG: hypothetical protein Ct9H300mP21_06070 [Pseudomonadota bacterium]